MDMLRGGWGPGLLGNGAGGGGAAAIFASATVNLDMTNAGTASSLTCTRSGAVAYADNLAGVWSNFTANTPRITDKGLLLEELRVNVCLWNRDLTNAAWVKTNITPVKDQTGIDGVANSASKITATAANGTCLLTTTISSSIRFQSAFVKRITGSGVVNMTMDNGTTWTAVTVTAGWTRVTIPTQTMANPIVGFRLVTSGDAIAVDMVQNENGLYATSPLSTTTATVSRSSDTVIVSNFGTWFSPSVGTIYVEGLSNTGTVNGTYLRISDGTSNNQFNLGNGTSNTVFSTFILVSSVNQCGFSGGAVTSTPVKMAMAYAVNDIANSFNGAAVGTDTLASLPTVDRAGFGGTLNTTSIVLIKRFAYWNTRLTNAQLQAITG